MNIDLNMTREQLIEVISAIMTLERDRLYNMTSSSKVHAILEGFNFELHASINPNKEEWINTDYFKEYFTREMKERFIKND
jgi:hypothetical protein